MESKQIKEMEQELFARGLIISAEIYTQHKRCRIVTTADCASYKMIYQRKTINHPNGDRVAYVIEAIEKIK
jgi:hypothetical protein